jgi:lipopolysaccharide/colanic/teichoic acid biosynthesis glycosyltransferase
MAFIVANYKSYERIRLTVKPGLTGLWQILGCKGQPIHENIEYDLYYVRKCSFRLDLWIILWTLPSILCREGFLKCKFVRSILTDILKAGYSEND